MTRSPFSRPLASALTLMAAIAFGGCTGGSPSPSLIEPSGAASVEPSAAASAATSAEASIPASEPIESLPAFGCAPSVTVPALTPRASITDVRVGTHQGYDRVVFEFDAGIPQTVIEAVLPPFYQDASGLPLEVAGSAFLKVTLTGASRVSPDGVVTYDGPTSFEPGFDQLVQLIEGGDFEAVSTWYLGLDGGGCIRALALSAPSRLVIDIEH